MNQIAKQLDETLRSLDPPRARNLEERVRQAIDEVERGDHGDATVEWPADYFEQTSGALQGEDFERPPQGELPRRDDW